MDLENAVFELIQNTHGHAASSTVMTFGDESSPFRATYNGPNVTFGHALVIDDTMLYHAADREGNLSAGMAKIILTDDTMTLQWRWLTGDQATGKSHWRRRSEVETCDTNTY